MKKIVFLAIFIIVALFQKEAFANENIIREIGVNANNDTIYLNIKSDYKEPYKTVKQNDGSFYVELKDAQLDDNYKTNSIEDTGILTQQIGSKARIYVLGDNTNKKIQTNLISQKGEKPVDYNEFGMILFLVGSLFVLALKFYSDTIKKAFDGNSVKCLYDDKEEVMLNKELLKNKIKPELVQHNKTNPITNEVFVNFEYAKNKKNIKIAI